MSIVEARGASRPPEERRVVFLIIATIPGAIAGLALEKYAESAFRDPRLIAVALIVMGIVLWAVDKYATRDRADRRHDVDRCAGDRPRADVRDHPGRLAIGIDDHRPAAALRLTRESAAMFSFLMSMPIIAAASMLKVPHVLKTEGLSCTLVVGVRASAISGWLAIAILLRFVVRRSYGVFAVYRVIVGLIVLAIAFSR